MYSFQALANYLRCDSLPCILLGDFNVNLLSDPHMANELDTSFGFKQRITEPTRVTPKSATLIDHVYTADIECVTSKVTELHIADHSAVSCTIMHSNEQENKQHHKLNSLRSMKHLNVDKLQDDLRKVQWSSLLHNASDVNEMLHIFYNNYLSIWNIHAAIITCRSRKRRTPWMTEAVLSLIHKRGKAYEKIPTHSDTRSFLCLQVTAQCHLIYTPF
jgi:hypothetical protein